MSGVPHSGTCLLIVQLNTPNGKSVNLHPHMKGLFWFVLHCAYSTSLQELKTSTVLVEYSRHQSDVVLAAYPYVISTVYLLEDVVAFDLVCGVILRPSKS